MILTKLSSLSWEELSYPCLQNIETTLSETFTMLYPVIQVHQLKKQSFILNKAKQKPLELLLRQDPITAYLLI